MGRHKGLLPVPGSPEPILEALLRHGRAAGLEPVLVGDAEPYAHLAEGVTRIDDEPSGGGPLAGLQAALRHGLRAGHSPVITVACDMPYVSEEALGQVRDYRSNAIIVAPRRGPDAPWEPMLARYDAARLAGVLRQAISRGQRSFQELFASTDIEVLPLTPAIVRSLQDWDTPQDMTR